ncbi:glycolate oxidase subunit GlcF [Thiosulfativibrio zosterae]|uniref:Glycolate oxidase iron-sulfur subunit n=1 Tax=Thiosulfativibrio zosterae TaxID=2675053 RepID=A0A6F8PQP7_9GAMM|nr:glycolate oxidase subunit GlcF [Thiosulfativibrio zosterae]BBP44435.1 glycolate oxidase iron-sulfur subunit [Thiosulfativibrio zosterae]
MQTNLPQDLLATPKGQTADKILRSCVHCGFCLSACPTYGILGDELDSPRGRIYLIKQALEGNAVSANTLNHLDRCLTCRSCETTCPSGVEYSHLLDIGREVVEAKAPRPLYQKLMRFGLRKTLTMPWLFNSLVKLAPWVKHSKADSELKQFVQAAQLANQANPEQRQVLLIAGCVQPALAPNINLATIKVLHQLGIGVLETPQSQCCGSVSHHLSGGTDTLTQVKRNIDAWIAELDRGVEAIISNTSGCGVMIKDYGHLLKDDADYAAKAKRISAATLDISEFLLKQDLTIFKRTTENAIVFQSPCTLQHGQKLPGLVEKTLIDLGFKLNFVADSHLCCGSAGTYSIFQPELSNKLRDNKLNALLKEAPATIVTANIGCLMHLQKGTQTPVKHWIELL